MDYENLPHYWTLCKSIGKKLKKQEVKRKLGKEAQKMFVHTKGGRIKAENPIDLVDLDKTYSLKDSVKEKENSSSKKRIAMLLDKMKMLIIIINN